MTPWFYQTFTLSDVRLVVPDVNAVEMAELPESDSPLKKAKLVLLASFSFETLSHSSCVM